VSARVLYVDDDRSNVVVFRAAFGEEFDLVCAESGAAALEILERDREIAVLLTDQRMPGMSGVQLAEIAKKRFPDVVRYLITAYTELDAAIDAINLGQVHRYLRKPWDPAEMRVHLHEGLELFALRRRVRDLERRMREVERVYALGIVAGSVVHELRNPMSALIGYLELARAQSGQIGYDIDRALEGAWEAAVRMTDLARGVELTTRRTPHGRRGDLGEVTDLTVKLVINELRHRAMAMIDVEPNLPVPVSATQLGQVALNLVINALQAIPEDRQPDDAKIRITAARRGDHARLEVSDNGPGVPEELRQRIFDPFFTTKLEGGTGLGLAITRQIIEEAGGRIAVEETPGGGATFVVELPLLDE
jgi:signal transduction histidine kinase